MGSLTILHAPGEMLAKRYWRRPDGSVGKGEAPNVAEFFTETAEYDDAADLFDIFEQLAGQPDRCVLRGEPSEYHPKQPGVAVYRRSSREAGWCNRDGRMVSATRMLERNSELAKAGKPVIEANVCWLPMFREAGSDFVAIDIEGLNWASGGDWVNDLEETGEIVRDSILPSEFRGASCWVQATGSALDPAKAPDNPKRYELRLRLVFKLTTRLTFNQFKAWFKGRKGIDPSTFKANQPVYAARPVFLGGMRDHLPRRSVTIWGEVDEVEPPADVLAVQPYGSDDVGGTFTSATGAGLQPCEAFEEALARVGDAAGECRTRLGIAASVYARAVGRDNVDAEALVERLAEEGRKHRSAGEVAGYGLPALVAWHCRRAPEEAGNRIYPDYDPFSSPGATDGTSDPADPANDDNPHAEPVVEPTAAEASRKLRDHLDAAITRALDYRQKEDGSNHGEGNTVLKVTAGLGKTTLTLDILAERTKGLTTHYYAPTHDLGEEVAEKARARGLDAGVVKGRGRKVGTDANGNDVFMCQKSQLAEEIARAGLPVWPSLCEAPELEGEAGVPHKCEFFDSCRYVQQFKPENIDGKMLVMSHEWLGLDKSRLGAAELSIVDERFFHTLIRGGNFCLDRITRTIDPMLLASVNKAKGKKARKVKGAAGPGDDETWAEMDAWLAGGDDDEPIDLEAHAVTARKVRAAIEAGQPPREHGATIEELERAHRTESYFIPSVWITPAMPRYQQKALAQEYAMGAEARSLAWLYEILIDTYDDEALTHRVQLVRNCKRSDSDELADRVFIRSKRAAGFAKHAAAVVIDASANVDILDKFMVVGASHEINAPIQARVTQVLDTACSRNKLSQRKQVARIVALARQFAEAGKRVLLVSYKPVIEAVGAIEGVDTLFFGKLRGVDRFKGYDVVIIAGREQTRPEKVEAQARAIFGGKLELPGSYVKERRRYRAKDGVARFTMTDVHPDPRVQAVVEQYREEETIQAVARLRLVHRPSPADVYLLSNMPTALEVDHFTHWAELLPNKAEQATQDAGGIELLTYSEMARCHPDRWPTAEAARKWRAREKPRTKSNIDSVLENVRGFVPEYALVAYRTVAGSSRGPAPQARIPAHMAKDKPAAERKLAAIVGELAVVEWLEEPQAAAEQPERKRAVF